MAPAQAQDGETVILEEPRIDVELDGIDPATLEFRIGNALGNDFVMIEGDLARVTVPFPESTEPFLLTIADRETGEVLVEQAYRMNPYRPFDRIEVDAYGQIDPYATLLARIDPDPGTVDSNQLDADAVGGLTWRGEVGDVVVNLEGEGVMTTEEFKRFRSDGGPVDLSNVLGALDYNGESFNGRVEFGDASIQGNNSVVNEGFTTKGGHVELSFLEDRLRFTGGFAYGQDVAGVEHMPGFDEQDSNRLTGGVDVTLWRDEYVNLTWHGSFYNAERPDDFGGFQTGETPVGERNRILGTGATLGLFEDRVVIESAFGWSEYANPQDLDFGVTDFTNFDLVEVGNENDTAQRHRLDARIWDGDTLRVDGYAQYESAGPFYRSLDAYIPPDRTTYLFGGSVSYDIVSLELSREFFDTNINGIPGVISTREGTDRGTLSFDFEDFRRGDEDGETDGESNGGACILCQAIPSNVTFDAEQWRVNGTNGGELVSIPNLFFTEDFIPSERMRNLSLDMSWDFDEISTDLAVFRNFRDDNSVGNGDADVRESGIEIGGSYFGDVWNFSTGVSVAAIENLQIDNDGTDYEYIWDGSLGLSLEDLPDFSAYGEVNLFRSKADFDLDDSRELSYRAQGTLDFSKFLPEVTPGLDSYLTTTFLYQWNVSKDSFSGTTHNIDMSWTVNFGVEF